MIARTEFQLDGVERSYAVGGTSIYALNGVTLKIYPGEYVAISGRSGSGKTSLMNILGLLDRPDKGSLILRGVRQNEMSAADLAELRARHIGFVFQSYQLLPDMTALENVALAGLYSGVSTADRLVRARALLESIGLADRVFHFPAQLSGGQQQRVAVARALFNPGAILLADEPTGSLDSASANDLLDLFASLHLAGTTIVVVTHDPTVAAHAERVITMLDGKVVADNGSVASEPVRCQVADDNARPQLSLRGRASIFVEMVALALSLMARRPIRTALTIFGNIVGIASIIVIIAVGEGARQSVDRTLSSLGANLVIVMLDESRLPFGALPPLAGC